jgi:hypothetical protein
MNTNKFNLHNWISENKRSILYNSDNEVSYSFDYQDSSQLDSLQTLEAIIRQDLEDWQYTLHFSRGDDILNSVTFRDSRAITGELEDLITDAGGELATSEFANESEDDEADLVDFSKDPSFVVRVVQAVGFDDIKDYLGYDKQLETIILERITSNSENTKSLLQNLNDADLEELEEITNFISTGAARGTGRSTGI